MGERPVDAVTGVPERVLRPVLQIGAQGDGAGDGVADEADGQQYQYAGQDPGAEGDRPTGAQRGEAGTVHAVGRRRL
ncbi:hypothetical protein [Streptomyces sp. NPDC057877]|uniref:hypothetical protein n=1 Tax=Streptomyces sp. NPDC057877 TaxID=3346269 RepID=UPI003679DD27